MRFTLGLFVNTQLPVKTFSALLAAYINQMEQGAPALTDFTPGSVPLAIGEATTAQAISVQAVITHVANICRLASSQGADVDSFVADFGLTRISAALATGTVTLNRNNTSAALNIIPSAVPAAGPNVANVQTNVGGVQFQIISDVTQPAWNATLGAYVMPIGTGSITVTVKCLTAGTVGNVLANTITQIVSLQGVDSVNNGSAFTNGVAQETDSALKLRFVNYLAALSKATAGAVGAAINAVQNGLTYQLLDHLTFALASWPGNFTVVVDDGSGAIPSGTLTSVSNAVQAVKALGVGFAVSAPTNVTVAVAFSWVLASGYTQATVHNALITALTNYINTLGVGVNVTLAGIDNIIATTPGVASYTASSVLINGVNGTLTIAVNQLPRASTITPTP